MDCTHSDHSLLVPNNLEELADTAFIPCDLITAELASKIQRLELMESSNFILNMCFFLVQLFQDQKGNLVILLLPSFCPNRQ
jgi:hypothetical protein